MNQKKLKKSQTSKNKIIFIILEIVICAILLVKSLLISSLDIQYSRLGKNNIYASSSDYVSDAGETSLIKEYRLILYEKLDDIGNKKLYDFYVKSFENEEDVNLYCYSKILYEDKSLDGIYINVEYAKKWFDESPEFLVGRELLFSGDSKIVIKGIYEEVIYKNILDESNKLRQNNIAFYIGNLLDDLTPERYMYKFQYTHDLSIDEFNRFKVEMCNDELKYYTSYIGEINFYTELLSGVKMFFNNFIIVLALVNYFLYFSFDMMNQYYNRKEYAIRYLLGEKKKNIVIDEFRKNIFYGILKLVISILGVVIIKAMIQKSFSFELSNFSYVMCAIMLICDIVSYVFISINSTRYTKFKYVHE